MCLAGHGHLFSRMCLCLPARMAKNRQTLNDMARYKLTKKRNRINAKKDGLWYAEPAKGQKMSALELCRMVTKDTTLTAAELALALDLLAERLPMLLARGMVLRVGRLGSLLADYGSEGVARPEDFHPRMMRRPRIVFRPSAELRKALEQAMFYELAGLNAAGLSFGSVESFRRWEQENGSGCASVTE